MRGGGENERILGREEGGRGEERMRGSGEREGGDRGENRKRMGREGKINLFLMTVSNN